MNRNCIVYSKCNIWTELNNVTSGTRIVSEFMQQFPLIHFQFLAPCSPSDQTPTKEPTSHTRAFLTSRSRQLLVRSKQPASNLHFLHCPIQVYLSHLTQTPVMFAMAVSIYKYCLTTSWIQLGNSIIRWMMTKNDMEQREKRAWPSFCSYFISTLISKEPHSNFEKNSNWSNGSQPG